MHFFFSEIIYLDKRLICNLNAGMTVLALKKINYINSEIKRQL